MGTDNQSRQQGSVGGFGLAAHVTAPGSGLLGLFKIFGRDQGFMDPLDQIPVFLGIGGGCIIAFGAKVAFAIDYGNGRKCAVPNESPFIDRVFQYPESVG